MRALFLLAILTLTLSLAAPALAEQETTISGTLVPSEPYSWEPGDRGDVGNVAIFRDWLPWGSNRDDQILMANQISFTVYGSGSIGVVDLSPFDKVIISNNQDYYFNAIVISNSAWFQTFAGSGGCVLYGLAHYFGEVPLGQGGPGGFALMAEEAVNVMSIAAPGHPIFNDPNVIQPSALNYWNYSSHGEVNVPAGGQVLLNNAEFVSGPAVVSLSVGLGSIVATTQPYQWDGASYAYAENLVLFCETGTTPTIEMTVGQIKALFR